MRRPSAVALIALGLASAAGCRDDPPIERHYPMRTPPAGDPPPPSALPSDPSATGGDETGGETSEPKLAERPPADPAIDGALDLIGSSGLRFIDQAEDEDSRASHYTAEQFAGMLRSKWDWLGYDITAIDPWLEEIATRSFKTNLPYQVVLANGRIVELRPWLERELMTREGP